MRKRATISRSLYVTLVFRFVATNGDAGWVVTHTTVMRWWLWRLRKMRVTAARRSKTKFQDTNDVFTLAGLKSG